MASYSSAWLVGSVRDVSYTAFTIDPDDAGVAPADGTVSIAGDFYLWNTTDAISLLDELVVQMTAAGVTTPAATLTRDRKVKLTAGANFAITWSTDTALRDYLGFTGNLSGAATYTATNVSPLLWSPAKPLLPGLSPLSCDGNDRPLAYWTASPSDGTPFVVSHGTRTDQTWTAASVAVNRIQTAAETNGEWSVFFRECACKGWNFTVYPSVTEESGSSTAATLTSPLGPYALSPSGRAPTWEFRRSRGFDWLNARADLTIACRVVPEYS